MVEREREREREREGERQRERTRARARANVDEYCNSCNFRVQEQLQFQGPTLAVAVEGGEGGARRVLRRRRRIHLIVFWGDSRDAR